jgi:hypothetical protein
MKLETSLPIGKFLDLLELPAELRADVARMIRDYWSKGEHVEFKVDIDSAEAFAAVEKAGMIPEPSEPDIDELIEADDLVDGIKALLAGDLPLATIMFARALGADNATTRAVEDAIRAHGRKLGAATPAAALAA